MSAAAGWYADPSGVSGQLRWWDGARWTDHVTPDPSAVPASAGASGAGEAHAAGGGVAEPTQPPPPSGTPMTGAASGGGSGGTWGSGDATRPSWQVDTPVPTSGSSVRTGLIVAAVIGAVVLGGVALLVIGVVRTGSVTFDDGGTFEVGQEWDGETVDGGRLSVGSSVRDRVPSDGTYEVTVDIEDAGAYLIDARGDGDFDGMLEVRGPSGDLLGENDDRDDELVDRVGGDWRDPLLELDLEPGEHRVIVRGWMGDGGSFSLTVDRPDRT